MMPPGGCVKEPVGLGNRRLQTTEAVQLSPLHLPIPAIGLQIRQKLSPLSPIFAFDAPSPTGSQARECHISRVRTFPPSGGTLSVRAKVFIQRYVEEASHIAWFDLLGRAERIA